MNRSVRLLQLLASQDQGLTVTEVAHHQGISVAAASRTLHALRSSGALTRDDESGRFNIAINLWPIGAAALKQMRFRRIALSSIALALPSLGRPLNIGVPDADRALIIEHIEMVGDLVFSTPMGSRVPYHASTAGKTLLAFLPEENCRQILSKKLEKFTPNTITNQAVLLKDLVETRQVGFAKNRGEFRESSKAIGVPLLDANGYPVAALTMFASEEEMHRAAPVVQNLLKLSQSISTQLGHGSAL